MNVPEERRRDRQRLLDELARAICDRAAVLFVGSGVSAQLGLPSWRGLIDYLGEDLGFDASAFRALSDDFRPLAEYYRIRKGSVDALRRWMDEKWTVDDSALRASRVHEIIAGMPFRLIYTTNYDDLLERAFALHGLSYNKIVTAKDIARADASLPTIVKFHGDFGDEDSLVISETDYFRRLSFETPLDIKLAADALGRTVLFIGYSLSDINVRLMLYRMRNIWRDSGYQASQPRSYLFMPRPNVVQETILDSWGITAVTGEDEDEGAALRSFMERLRGAVYRRAGGSTAG